jgi:hypothetical protein
MVPSGLIPPAMWWGGPGKHAAQVELDPSSSVPIPTLPPHLLTLVSNLLVPAGQDARSTKLPVSSGPSSSPYIESPHRRLRNGDQTGHLVPGNPTSLHNAGLQFPGNGGCKFGSTRQSSTAGQDKDTGSACSSGIVGE